MTGIQILLIGGIVFILIYYISRFRNALIDLFLLVFFSGIGVFFIVFPSYTQLIAKFLGVGRGADLIFYTSILFFLFISVKLFARIRRLELKLTQLIREQAINEAKNFDSDNPNVTT